MKKRLLLAAGLFTLFAVTSCSSKETEVTVDNADLYTDIAKEWTLNGGYEGQTANVDLIYGNDIINTEGEVQGAHFTLSLPSAENYDDLIRTHQVRLSYNDTRTGEISTIYGVMNSSILTFKTTIENAISKEENMLSIKNKISLFDAEVQTSYSKTYNVSQNSNDQIVYTAYIPALFRYYSDTETLSLLSFVFIPVKTIISTSEEFGTNLFVNTTSNKEIHWTVDKNNVIEDIIKE